MQIKPEKKINPWKLAADYGYLQGEIALSRMARLTPLLHTYQGNVTVFMKGGIDEQGIHYLTGRLETTLELICQRCFTGMPLPSIVEFQLAPVHTEAQMDTLPKAYDPLLVEKGWVKVADIVEDELILTLPLIPLHQDIKQCEARGFVAPVTEPATIHKPNPFAALSVLLKDSKNEE